MGVTSVGNADVTAATSEHVAFGFHLVAGNVRSCGCSVARRKREREPLAGLFHLYNSYCSSQLVALCSILSTFAFISFPLAVKTTDHVTSNTCSPVRRISSQS